MYVDVLVVVNMIIDLILLLCTAKLLHLRTKPLRLLIAAAIGGAVSLTALLPKVPFPLNLLIDVSSAALLVLAAFGKTRLRGFLTRALTLFSVSFSFCGVMVFVCTVFRPKGIAVYNDVVYFNISPPVLIALTLLCYYMLRLMKKFTKGAIGKPVCTVALRGEGKEVSFRAVVDSGCRVREPFSGDYVIIAERSCVEGVSFKELSQRLIPFDSLGGSGVLSGMRVEEVRIDGREIEDGVYIGVCDGVLKGEVKAIVPFEIIKFLNVR